jgi:hypothetical protein
MAACLPTCMSTLEMAFKGPTSPRSDGLARLSKVPKYGRQNNWLFDMTVFDTWYESMPQSNEPEREYTLSDEGLTELTKECMRQAWDAATMHYNSGAPYFAHYQKALGRIAVLESQLRFFVESGRTRGTQYESETEFVEWVLSRSAHLLAAKQVAA